MRFESDEILLSNQYGLVLFKAYLKRTKKQAAVERYDHSIHRRFIEIVDIKTLSRAKENFNPKVLRKQLESYIELRDVDRDKDIWHLLEFLEQDPMTDDEE